MMKCAVIEAQRDLLGTVVVPKNGRDRDNPGVIIDWLPGEFALVADGKRRTAAKPKKKNMKHLVFTKCRPAALTARLLNGEKATDRMIREGLAAYGGVSGEGRQYG